MRHFYLVLAFVVMGCNGAVPLPPQEDECVPAPCVESGRVIPVEDPLQPRSFAQGITVLIGPEATYVSEIEAVFRDAEGDEINRCRVYEHPRMLELIGGQYSPRHLSCQADRVAATVEVLVHIPHAHATLCAPIDYGRAMPGEYILGHVFSNYQGDTEGELRELPVPLPIRMEGYEHIEIEERRAFERCIYELPTDQRSLYAPAWRPT